MELAIGLKTSAWGDIDRWTQWLTEKGYEISRTAVGRYNQRAKQRFERAWEEAEQTAAMAKILVANNQDDGGAVLKANELLASDGLLRMQTALRELEEQIEDMETAEEAQGLTITLAETQAKMVRAVAELNKAGIQRAKWQEQIRAKLDKTMAGLEAQTAEGAGDGKLDADTLAAVRREVYGLIG